MPLTRQYNFGPVVNLIDNVNQFSMTPAIATNTESYPGLATEDATESLLIDNSATTGPGNQNITINNWAGQIFSNASWPAGAVGCGSCVPNLNAPPGDCWVSPTPSCAPSRKI